ncbi:MAG: RNA polymerase sigma factor [Pseudomonadota bacterium]|nr:RNA polymerase sigma factor [Pseudomonadota bacterium]
MIDPPASQHYSGVRSSRPGPELLARVADGDREARRDLFEAWAPIVLRWCAHLGGPNVDPEDAAHDVLVTAMARLPSLVHPDRFDAWMFGITRRVLVSHRRSGWVRRWLPGLMGDIADPREGPGHITERHERAGRVRAALEEMPGELREVLVLCDLEERTDAAVSVLLGLPSGTVKSRLRRARVRFSELARRHGLSADSLTLHAGEGR